MYVLPNISLYSYDKMFKLLHKFNSNLSNCFYNLNNFNDYYISLKFIDFCNHYLNLKVEKIEDLTTLNKNDNYIVIGNGQYTNCKYEIETDTNYYFNR